MNQKKNLRGQYPYPGIIYKGTDPLSERKLRIIIGIILMVTGFAAPLPDLWHMAFLSFGVALLMPSALGFCPFKALLLRKLS